MTEACNSLSTPRNGTAPLLAELLCYFCHDVHTPQPQLHPYVRICQLCLHFVTQPDSYAAVQVCSMPFVCSKCGAETERSFGNDARYNPPTACSTEGCRSRNFRPQYKAARCLNWQQVRLQVLTRPRIALLAGMDIIWAQKV